MEGVFQILKIPELIGNLIAFGILFWLLKRFLWGHILNTIDRRRHSIELAYQEVENRQREAEKLKRQLEERLAGMEEEARQRLEEAAREGRRLADEIRAAAEAQRERMLSRAQADISREREKARVELNNYTADLAIDITEKLLRKQLDREEHRRLIRALTEEL